MDQPSLRQIRYWENHERRVMAVLVLALRRLMAEGTLPRSEDSLNRRLYFCMLEAIRELSRQGTDFSAYLMYEANNQPDADDEERATREGKRPDFQFGYIDHQEPDPRRSAKQYVVECKRLGNSGRSDWVLNDNYCVYGVARFHNIEHGYGQGVPVGAMIGYIQNMTAAGVLAEVNASAKVNSLPELVLSQAGWVKADVSRLDHSFQREVVPSPFAMRHLWLDLAGNSLN